LGTHESFDLSALSLLNNNPNVYFRIVDDSTTAINGGTVGTAGTDRIDNFTVAVVPEPTGLFVFGGFTFLAWNLIRRRK
jgi:hypothetical protein